MLTFDSSNPLHKHYTGAKHPTKQVPGINASDMNLTGQKTTRDCRLTDKRPPGIRVKAPVGVTGGDVFGATGDRNVRYGRIPKAKRASLAQRKAARRERVIRELRKRGYNV